MIADLLISDHALYQELAGNEALRQFAYRALFAGHLEPEALHCMRESSAHNYPLANDPFRESIVAQLGRAVGYQNAGRPALTK